jgi:hypothetical protein
MTTTKFDLHKAALELARDTIKAHIQEEDGETCFNLYTFIQGVEMRLDTIWNGNGSPTGRFELRSWEVARYLWCCLALEGGDAPDGTTFRGMPILD